MKPENAVGIIQPCPFCSGEAVVNPLPGERGCAVECEECDAAGPPSYTHGDAIARWNARTILSQGIVQPDDARDAARYRFIRSAVTPSLGMSGEHYLRLMVPSEWAEFGTRDWTAPYFDRAVDAFMGHAQ